LKPRKERGWTKEYKNYIFSAAGYEGLDIYEIYALKVTHVL